MNNKTINNKTIIKKTMISKNDIPNKIKQSCLCCIYCGKSYKTRNNMDKHLVLCETIYRSKNNKPPVSLSEDDIEDIQLPTQKQMYNIILELTMKYNKLEEKMEQMTKWIEKKKKKMNVIEWLNTNVKPICTFNELINEISITNDNIDTLLSSGFISAFAEVMTMNIFEKKEKKEKNPFPIFCLDQKTNHIYVCTTQSDQSATPVWAEIEKETLIHFVNKIYMRMTKGLTDWKKQLESQHNFNDTNTDLYNRTLIKMLDLNFKNETVLNKIKGVIYNGMKTDIKALIEYEIEFEP